MGRWPYPQYCSRSTASRDPARPPASGPPARLSRGHLRQRTPLAARRSPERKAATQARTAAGSPCTSTQSRSVLQQNLEGRHVRDQRTHVQHHPCTVRCS